MDCAACAKHRGHELEGPTWAELIFLNKVNNLNSYCVKYAKLQAYLRYFIQSYFVDL